MDFQIGYKKWLSTPQIPPRLVKETESVQVL